MLDYTDSFNAVLLVVKAVLSHAGKVEVFEDDDGWLCIRTSLMKSFTPKFPEGIVHEPIGFNYDEGRSFTPNEVKEIG